MKRSTWIPLLAAGAALVGVVAGALAVLKKKKPACAEEPIEADATEITGEDCCECCDPECCCEPECACDAPAEDEPEAPVE